jgi:DNA-binding transcriptional regulator YiaG
LGVRAIRSALGYTQRDFAFYLRVAVNTVSAWENGHRTPSGLAEGAIRELCAREGLDLHTMRRFT